MVYTYHMDVLRNAPGKTNCDIALRSVPSAPTSLPDARESTWAIRKAVSACPLWLHVEQLVLRNDANSAEHAAPL